MDIFNDPRVRVASNGSWLDAEPRKAPTSRTNAEPVERYASASGWATTPRTERPSTPAQRPWWM